MSRRLLHLLTIFTLLTPSAALSQGFLVDTSPDRDFRLPRIIIEPPFPRPRPLPQTSYKIKELGVDVNLTGQIAKVQVTQSFVNTGSRQMEVSFVFPLPYDGAVDRLTFMVDGKEHEAKLLDAKKAREIYEGYIRRNQDPALMEWIGTGMFKTSVFPVPPGAERTVTLRYTQLCKKHHGLTDLVFPLSAAKFTSRPVEKVRFDITINAQANIKNVYSPTHSVEVERPSQRLAKVSYESSNEAPQSDFRLMYDIGDAAVQAQALSYRPLTDEEGYFLLLVSPEIKSELEQAPKKSVVFVVDRSGSMSGKKIEQAKGALKFVLNNLNEGDIFNIVAYDSSVESFRPEMQRFEEQTREEALAFVEGIYAGGSTNIDGALKAALGQLQDKKRPSYVLFLTDGLPTAGETNETKIVETSKQRNDVRARLFTFGVGYDVNSRLLDKLSRAGFGDSNYVRPNEDIEQHVSRLYNRIGAPAMTDVALAFYLEGWKIEQGPLATQVYPKQIYDLFAGDQLVVVGRYKKSGDAKVTVSGKIGDREEKFDFPANLVEESSDESFAFIEKLWAVRRIGEIIDQIDLQGKNQELIDELVAIATRHGIITPYTSFLADDQQDFRDLAGNRRSAGVQLEALSQTSGRSGFEQRALKGFLQRAQNAPAATPAAPSSADAPQFGQGGFGAGELRGGRGLPGNPATATVPLEEAEEAARPAVKIVGKKTFYRRGDRWIDASVTKEQEEQAVKLERYSKEWFDLVDKHGKDIAKYLSLEGSIVLKIDGKVYSF